MSDITARNLAVSGELNLGSWGTVTQASSITTGVTCSTKRGAITTVDPALAAAGEAEFVVTNTECHATSIVLVAVASGPADGEHVFANVTAIAEGSFSVCIANHGTAQADGVMVIHFQVF